SSVVTKRKSELQNIYKKTVFSQFSLPCSCVPSGQEFVVPKSGYFCNLCRVFYLNESSAKEDHCGSQRHYDNLQVRSSRLSNVNSSHE
uniref:Matrin-type domain-containing protein n=1 Tax=Scophthalmus maximus TaxID=52904 RepID=A0A8D3C4T8_SCOMX